MTFEEFLKKSGIHLRPWQRRAALALLREMDGQQGHPSGKSFLIQALSEFVSEHGNEFELPCSGCDHRALFRAREICLFATESAPQERKRTTSYARLKGLCCKEQS